MDNQGLVYIHEDYIIIDLIQATPSYFDPYGDIPLILDLNGRPLTKEEILKLVQNE